MSGVPRDIELWAVTTLDGLSLPNVRTWADFSTELVCPLVTVLVTGLQRLQPNYALYQVDMSVHVIRQADDDRSGAEQSGYIETIETWLHGLTAATIQAATTAGTIDGVIGQSEPAGISPVEGTKIAWESGIRIFFTRT